ncbi:MAG: glycoside hydrolase family 43 protein [Polyangiaceae bacterium]
MNFMPSTRCSSKIAGGWLALSIFACSGTEGSGRSGASAGSSASGGTTLSAPSNVTGGTGSSIETGGTGSMSTISRGGTTVVSTTGGQASSTTGGTRASISGGTTFGGTTFATTTFSGGAGGKSAATGGTTGGVSSSGGVGGRTTGNIGGTSVGGTTTSAGGSRATFRNPLNTTQGSDPFMVHYQGAYYLAATTWGTTLTMKRGRTIEELKNNTPTVIWKDTNASRSGNMWAPEFHLLDNGAGQTRWYHYYTAGDGKDLGTQRSYVLESDGTDPMGPYHFKAQLLNYWAIDGSVLKVGTRLFFMFSAWQGSTQNIWIMAMDNPWTVSGNRTLLSAPTYAWEQEGTDSVNEGPVALYHQGRTFVTYSASQCASPGYKLGMLELVGSNPLLASSWRKSATPVFQAANGAIGPGHNGFFTSPDGTENWLVYHATANAAGSCWTDRTTRIQRIAWNADGTPNFGVPLALTTNIPVPSGE